MRIFFYMVFFVCTANFAATVAVCKTGSAELTRQGKQEIFVGVGVKTVYNPTAPFNIDGQTVIAARVESKHSERDYETRFFKRGTKGVWVPILAAPQFKMQDPFHTVIGGEHILGGVETFDQPNGGLGYKTVFYKGKTLDSLVKFAEGPNGMKDIRLLDLQDKGKVLVFTRPQGIIPGTGYDAGEGKVGAIIIDNLEQLTPETIYRAKILEGLFKPGQWGGVNEPKLLENGKVLLLVHSGEWKPNHERLYIALTSEFDPKTFQYTPPEKLLERSDLPDGLAGPSKKDDLRDIVFSGGLEFKEDNSVVAWVGAGDAAVYSAPVKRKPHWTLR